jgi:chromosome segregation ATPase
MKASLKPTAAMATPVTDTELKEVLNALAKLTEGVAAMSQRMEVGFAQVDTKFAQMEAKIDTKLSETKAELKGEIQRVEAKMDAQFTEVKGDIKVVDQRVVALDDKMTGLDDRLKAQDAKFWTLVTIIIGSLAATVSTFVIRYVLPAIPVK